MKKSFHALMIESVQDHTYYVKSISNIHDEEKLERIALALTPHELIEIKPDGFQPIAQHNELFPKFANTPTYTLKVVLGMEVNPTQAVQSIAMFANIDDEYLVMMKKGDKPGTDEEIETGEEVTDSESQNMAGEKRIGAFLKDLEDDRKKRGDGKVRDVYESFCVPYTVVSKTLGRPMHRGFYIVEQFGDSPGVGTMTGPFRKQPVNYEYSNAMAPVEIISEDVKDGQTVFKLKLIEFDDIPVSPSTNDRKWDVEVMDVDSGKKYDLVVNADCDVTARNRAIDIIAAKTGMDSSKFITTDPEG